MESYYTAPPVLLTNEQAQQLRVLNGRSCRLELPNEQEDIDNQLNKRPGILRPDSGLRTSQGNVPRPPKILLASPAPDKPKARIRHHGHTLRFNNFIIQGRNQYDKAE